MSTLARSLVVGVMIALSLGTVGCNAAYWQEIGSFSIPRADVSVPGKVEWSLTLDDVSGEVTKAESKVTHPSVTLSLDANSSPVTYTTAQADFFYTEGTTNDAGKLAENPLSDVPTQFFPFATILKSGDRASGATLQTVVLHGLIPTKLVDITNPMQQGYQRLTAAVAKVTLKGTNGFGASVTTKVSIPIIISY